MLSFPCHVGEKISLIKTIAKYEVWTVMQVDQYII